MIFHLDSSGMEFLEVFLSSGCMGDEENSLHQGSEGVTILSHQEWVRSGVKGALAKI